MERLPCMHGGTYADDCICERVRQHRCYIVATCDRDLRRRLRKVRRAQPLLMLSPCSCPSPPNAVAALLIAARARHPTGVLRLQMREWWQT